MIIIGYQGIGKSTLAGTDKYIDLESENFWVNGERDGKWYIPYCNIAEHLSSQGFIVFTSSHEVVRNQLRDSKEQVYIIYPSLELKDKWIQKLKDRYKKTKLEKDYRAYMNSLNRYEDNIKELMDSPFKKVEIPAINYNLKILIESSCSTCCCIKDYDSVDIVFEDCDYVTIKKEDIIVSNLIVQYQIIIKNLTEGKYKTYLGEDLFHRICYKDITGIEFMKNGKCIDRERIFGALLQMAKIAHSLIFTSNNIQMTKLS